MAEEQFFATAVIRVRVPISAPKFEPNEDDHKAIVESLRNDPAWSRRQESHRERQAEEVERHGRVQRTNDEATKRAHDRVEEIAASLGCDVVDVSVEVLERVEN